MSKLSYYDKQRAKAAIAHVLMKRDWKVHGYRPDTSDSMSDYFNPAGWGGIATKDDLTLVVDVSGYDLEKSGTEIIEHKMLPGPCSPCKGMGKSQRDEEAYTTQTLFSNVVTKHPFIPAGSPCKLCDSTGQRNEMREVKTGTFFPVFEISPKGSKWHLARNGKIIAKGPAVYAPILAGDYNCEPLAAEWLDKVLGTIESKQAPAAEPFNPNDCEACIRSSPRYCSAHSQAVDGITITPGKTPGFVDVKFPSKPDADTLAALKAAGFRWAKWAGCWWGPEANLPKGLVKA